MNKKKIIYSIILILIIALIAGIFYLVYFKKFNFKDLTNKNKIVGLVKNNDKSNQNEEITRIKINQQETVEPVDKEVAGRNEALLLAVSFTERFGTYSNQANYRNITDLKLFMTNAMASWADNYLEQQRAAHNDTSNYYGITTKVISKELKDYDDQRAIVTVKTRRQEANNTTDNLSSAFNQEATISLIKEGNDWKVDSISWGSK